MKAGIKALIRTLDDLRGRCNVDPITRCWEWTGAMATDGTPRIYAFCHRAADKRTMTGMQAAWNIAHDRAPLPGWIVGRCCGNRVCLNPVHLREFRSKAELGLHIRQSGRLKGNNADARRANMARAHAATGVVYTAPEIVLAIHAAPRSVTGQELVRQYGVSQQVVSRIRCGHSHRALIAQAQGVA